MFLITQVDSLHIKICVNRKQNTKKVKNKNKNKNKTKKGLNKKNAIN